MNNTPRTILLPPGTSVNGVATAIVVPISETQIQGMSVDNSNNLVINTLNSAQVFSMPCASQTAAFIFMQQIQNFLNSHGNRVFTPRADNIFGIAPDPFVVETSTITISANYDMALAPYVLHIEDWLGGGYDSDGYFMNCTVVDATHLTAVFGGPGNGVLPTGQCAVYLMDTNNTKYSALFGTVYVDGSGNHVVTI